MASTSLDTGQAAPAPASVLGQKGGQEGTLLGFVRLKCFSVARTIKFYTTCLGFDLKRKSELDDGALTLIILTPKAGEEAPLNLRFECERYKQLKFSKAAKVPICTTSRVKLVFYVRDLRTVLLAVERSVTGSWVFSFPQRHASVLIAIVVDPNGILIELVEMADALQKVPPQFINSGEQRHPIVGQVPVRFGHALIQSSSALDQARFYEALFRPRIDTRLARMSRVSIKSAPTPETRGITIVDKEDFPELLATYVWVGCGPRSHCTTVCFMHRVERRGVDVPRMRFAGNAKAGTASFKTKAGQTTGPAAQSNVEREETPASGRVQGDMAKKAFHFLMESRTAEDIDPFLGLGVLASDLDGTRARLERHTRYPIKFNDELHDEEAVGRLCSFTDEYGILVHLIDSYSAFLIDNPKEQPFGARLRRDSLLAAARVDPKLSRDQIGKFRELDAKRASPKPLIASTTQESSSSNPSASAPSSAAHARVFPARTDRIVEPS